MSQCNQQDRLLPRAQPSHPFAKPNIPWRFRCEWPKACLSHPIPSGHVARASLDTVDPEPLPDGHWIYSHPGIRLSPHISWAMPLAQSLLIDTFRENLRRYLDGRELANVVDVQLGY